MTINFIFIYAINTECPRNHILVIRTSDKSKKKENILSRITKSFVQERKIFFFNIHYTKDFIQKELIFLPLGILFQSSDHPDFLLTIALSSETIYICFHFETNVVLHGLTRIQHFHWGEIWLCVYNIYIEGQHVYYDDVRKVEIVRYTNNILRIFCSFQFFFFIARRRSKRFPDTYATIFAGFALFFHILIRVSSSCERWTGCYV